MEPLAQLGRPICKVTNESSFKSNRLSDESDKLDKLRGDGDFLGKKSNGSISFVDENKEAQGLEEPIPSMLRVVS